MFIHVAVPVPALDLLTYRVPDAMPVPAVAALTAAGLTVVGVGAELAPPEAIEGPSKLGPYARHLTAKQTVALEVLAGAPCGLPTSQLAARGLGAGTLSRLAASGLVNLRR